MIPSGGAARPISPISSRDRFHAVTAGYLGWTMDAFDFFVVVFLVDTLAVRFNVPKKEIVWTMTATLALRPVGAVVFGLLADRYGRRIPLMVNLLFFSTVEVLCGFAPNYATFLLLRALFGIGMGGEWGVGASLAMESAPRRWRGILSGVLQSGYSMGYLLAAVAARVVLPAWGWRAMFWVGGVPALLALLRPLACRGVRGVAPEARAERGCDRAGRAPVRAAPRLPRRADDDDDVPLARDAGPLSGLPEDRARRASRRRSRPSRSSTTSARSAARSCSATSRSASAGACPWRARSACACS